MRSRLASWLDALNGDVATEALRDSLDDWWDRSYGYAGSRWERQ